MAFEFDPDKSQSNETKHGIDFTVAQALWLDKSRIIFPANSETEQRYALLASYKDKIWIAFYTMREERVRIISVRRARTKEKKIYAS